MIVDLAETIRIDGKYPITPFHWACAYLLGDARTKTNDRAGRQSKDDYGDKENKRRDVYGALAELIVFEKVTGPGREFMRNHIFNAKGGVATKAPDLMTGEESVEVKGTRAKSNYRKVTVSKQDHDDLESSKPYYLFTFIPLWGRFVYVSIPLLWEQVDTWESAKPFDDGEHKIIDRALFLKAWFSFPPNLDNAEDASEVFKPADAKLEKTNAVDYLTREFPQIAPFL